MRALSNLTYVLVLFAVIAPASAADETSNLSTSSNRETLTIIESRIQESPDEIDTWQNYEAITREIAAELLRTDYQKAIHFADRMQRFIERNAPDDKVTRKTTADLHNQSLFYRHVAKAKQMTREAARRQWAEQPNSFEAVCIYEIRLQLDLKPCCVNDPRAVLEQVPVEEEFVNQHRDKCTDPSVRKIIQELDEIIPLIRNQRSKRLNRWTSPVSLPPPLTDVRVWINGERLTDADLKGKVILLDFWAVYCAPCIAAFPELRYWHKKYAERGLVTIGITRQNDYIWDEEAETAKQSNTEVPLDDEARTLQQFARKHELPFRIIVQDERKISSAFRVQSIPQLVLIDRQGKIRMIRVGHNEDISREVEKMVQTLLAEPDHIEDQLRPE